MFSVKSLLFLVAISFTLQNYAMEDQSAYVAEVIADIRRKTEMANIKYRGSITPLMYSVIMPEYRPYCKYFLDNDMSMSETAHVSTALMFAISINLEDLVLMLVDYASGLKHTRLGKAILDFAIKCNNSKIIEILRSRFADENQESGQNIFVTEDNRMETTNAQGNIEDRMVEEPDTTDEDLDQSDHRGNMSTFGQHYIGEPRNTNSLLNSNVASKEIAAITWPLEIKAQVIQETNAINKEPGFGVTPLMTAILLARFNQYAQLFLDENINAQSEDGSTALMLAVATNVPEIVQLLLLHNADMDLENNNGKTALEIALDNNLTEIADQLRAKRTSQIISGVDQTLHSFALNREEITEEVCQSEQIIDPMETDQFEAEQEESECEFDSDREFTINEGSFQDERDLEDDELDYASDAEFALNMASFDQIVDVAFSGNEIEQDDETELPEGIRERAYKCEELGCTKAYYKKSHLNRHIKVIHEKQRPYRCRFKNCAFTTGYKSDFKRHKLEHTGQKAFCCIIKNCRKKFFRKDHLAVHKLTHTQERPYACNQCQKRYCHPAHLARHINAKHKNIRHRCNIEGCEFQTAYKDELKYHERSHAGEKSYVCRSCKKRFLRKNELKIHTLTHGTRKPHRCDKCDYRTTQASNLKRHQKLVHK